MITKKPALEHLKSPGTHTIEDLLLFMGLPLCRTMPFLGLISHSEIKETGPWDDRGTAKIKMSEGGWDVGMRRASASLVFPHINPEMIYLCC